MYGEYKLVSSSDIAKNPEEIFRGPEHYVRKFVDEYLPPDKEASVLDLGCGNGVLVYFARQAGYRNVKGVDASASQVRSAREMGIDGIEEREVSALGYAWKISGKGGRDVFSALAERPEGSEDTIIAFDLLEHFDKAESLAFCDEVARVLKKGGKLILHVPNGESPFVGRTRYGDITHEQAFTWFSIEQLLRAAGFSTVSCYEDHIAVHGLKSGVRSLLWGLTRRVLRFVVAVETGDGGSAAIFTQNLIAVAVK